MYNKELILFELNVTYDQNVMKWKTPGQWQVPVTVEGYSLLKHGIRYPDQQSRPEDYGFF